MQCSCTSFHSSSVSLNGSGPSIIMVLALLSSSDSFIKFFALKSLTEYKQCATIAKVTPWAILIYFLHSLSTRLLYITPNTPNSTLLHKLINYNHCAHPMKHQEGEELYQLKQELYSVYQENIRLREIITQQNQEREFMSECEAELVRLRALLKEVTQKKSQAPTEREQIKDRIIMKLEDDLISTKIELKQTQMQLSRLNRQ